MIVLDENVPGTQRQLLRSWRISCRRIGVEVGRKGMKDDEIIPLLMQLRRPTFFTLDLGFFNSRLCHRRYCIAYLAVEEYEAASFARRLLRLEALDTEAKRMGKVIRASQSGLVIWTSSSQAEVRLGWQNPC
ncbi:MAG TPA: hypothetical protein VKU00_33320 [Chthonomonadaceae bacterium]|nr:hypothetical protein [Chthonomonadaceae bacterium]